MWGVLAILVTALWALVAVTAYPASDTERLALRALAKSRQLAPDQLLRVRLIGGGSSYAPYAMPCPSNLTWIRAAQGLSTGETNYLTQRDSQTSAPIQQMIANARLSQPPRKPVIGFALSGGGYRAMQNGLGGVMATMNESTEAAASGIGGWFGAVTYMAGLSGGSWGTGTFMANQGLLPTDLVTNVWDLESNLIIPDDDKLAFYYDLISEVDAKSDEGFPTQITDYWALALGDHLLDSPYHLDNSPNYTFSNITTLPALANASLPMPIIIAAEREEGEVVVAENATVWEFTPFEFGSWAFGSTTKVRGAFTPIGYLGSSLDNGSPNGTCYKGFDQLSFVCGTSSTLFNSALLELNSSDSDSVIVDAISSVLSDISEDEYDVSRIPNAFAHWTGDDAVNPIADLEYITLVDAGETNQNLPIEPLLIPARGVDAIIAFDSSADTTYLWPNGSALWTTYTRAQQLEQNLNVSIRMPAVPSTNGFVNGGLNTRPVFFGCNDTDTPVIIYVPNYPWSYGSNISTYQLAYEQDQSLAVINNGLRAFTLNGTVSTWPTCLACALTDRAFNYTATNRTQTCQTCFDTFCWNGVDNTTAPDEYEPVVGALPAFFTDNALVNASSTTATATGATSSQTQTQTQSGAAGRLCESYAGAPWTALLGGALGVVLGAAAVLA